MGKQTLLTRKNGNPALNLSQKKRQNIEILITEIQKRSNMIKDDLNIFMKVCQVTAWVLPASRRMVFYEKDVTFST